MIDINVFSFLSSTFTEDGTLECNNGFLFTVSLKEIHLLCSCFKLFIWCEGMFYKSDAT